jgi:predicted MFS family arabinose efflux permease
VRGQTTLLVLIGVFGVASGLAFVAISVGLTASSTPALRGLVMGGYSTSLYLGFAVGSFALGPVITRHGYAAGFALGAAAGVVGALVAGLLWTSARPRCPER